MRRHSMDSVFFCLAEGRGRLFLFFPLFPNVFSSCSHRVPQVLKLFPKTFPIAPQLYPLWFAQSPTLICRNWKRWAIGENIYFYFGTWGPRRYFYCGMSAQCFKKKWWWANQCASLQIKKEKEKCGCTHEPINMNHTHPQEQKGGPFTPWLDFSLVAWKFYS